MWRSIFAGDEMNMDSERIDAAHQVEIYRERLDKASARWGRKVEICAVSKTVEAERVNPVYEAGIRILGENRVQELLEKKPRLNPGFKLHLIGQLQTNKVKYIIPFIDMIQSLDRIALAEEIQKRAQACGRVVPVLIQINIGREVQKAGIMEEELEAFARFCAEKPNLSVRGLMAVAPAVSDPEQVRPYFRKMREWFDRLGEEQIPGVTMEVLSMGMTGDCVVAAEEGATMVRIGSGLFGRRNYPVA